MIHALVFALLSVLPVQAQQQQLDRMEQSLQQVQLAQRQINDLKQSLEQIRTLLQDELKPACSADVRWMPAALPSVWDLQTPVNFGLLSIVSEPKDGCLNAELRITATFYDASGVFVCSGSTALPQRDTVQNTTFEFRPLNIEYFAKWRDGPTWEQSTYHRLSCLDREGMEVLEPRTRSQTMKLVATVFPKRGGLAVAETSVTLPQPQTPAGTPFRGGAFGR